MAANGQDDTVTILWRFEPLGIRQQVEDIEEYGASCSCSGKIGRSASVGIAGPYTYDIFRRKPYGPRIAGSVARTCFPGHMLR